MDLRLEAIWSVTGDGAPAGPVNAALITRIRSS